MDNFIDKLAQKFIAGEVIKANSVAEEKELKRLREQVAEYEKCLQEMRKIQLTNTHTAQNLHDLMVESMESFRTLAKEGTESIQKFTEESLEAFRKNTEESSNTLQRFSSESAAKISDIQLESDVQKAEAKRAVEIATTAMENMQEQAAKVQEVVMELSAVVDKNQKEIEDWFKQADDFLHKENVKVYRNVQAVVVEEVEKKAELIMKSSEENTIKARKPVLIFAILGFLTALASLAVSIMNMLGVVVY